MNELKEETIKKTDSLPENIEPQVKQESVPKDDLLPAEIDSLPLERSATMIVGNIIKTDNIDDLKRLTKLFDINQAKKNALRVIKLNNLLDKVTDQAIERFTKRPYEVSNKELLDYMQVVQVQIEKSHQTIDKIDESPMITFNQQNNSINVTVGDEAADRESKERVMDAVSALLKAFKTQAPKEEAVIVNTPQVVDLNKKETETKGEKK